VAAQGFMTELCCRQREVSLLNPSWACK